jgi:hypothetical protein
VLTSLEQEMEPAGHLAEPAGALEGAYRRVLDGLGANTVVQFVGGRVQLERLADDGHGARSPDRHDAINLAVGPPGCWSVSNDGWRHGA